MKHGLAVFFAVCFLAGCSGTGKKGEPELAKGLDPTLSVAQLNKLAVEKIEEIFAPGEKVTVETLDRTGDPEDRMLTGRFVFSEGANVVLKLYPDADGVLTALTTELRGPIGSYTFHEPSERFPYAWWSREGPPGTILYTFGNVLVLIRISDLTPRDITGRGIVAAKKVALQILRCSKNLPPTAE